MTQGWGTRGKPRGLSRILYDAHEPQPANSRRISGRRFSPSDFGGREATTRNASAVRRLKNCMNIYRKEISLSLLTIIRIIQKQGQNRNIGAWDQFVFFLFHFVPLRV